MPSIVKTVIPVLAAASTAYAASCSISATTTLQNAGDATALASACSTFSGNIAIATGTTEDIQLDGLKQLSGNLVAESAPFVRRVGGNDLQVAGLIKLSNMTRLSAISFPNLKQVTSLNFVGLPALSTFEAAIESAQYVTVQNTRIQSLSSIDIPTANSINVADNPSLPELTLSTTNLTGSLTVAGINKNIKVNLPNLQSAANITFRSCASVNVPSLASVGGAFGMYDNDFDSFGSANLTSVGNALAAVANNKLTNLTFPALTKIGGNLQVANNTALLQINGFPELLSIGASMDVYGIMNDVETPKLNLINGTFNLQSTDNVTESCNFYQGLKNNKKIGGVFFCQGKLQDPGAQGHKPTSQSGSKGNAGSTLNPINGALALAAMAAVMIF